MRSSFSKSLLISVVLLSIFMSFVNCQGLVMVNKEEDKKNETNSIEDSTSKQLEDFRERAEQEEMMAMLQNSITKPIELDIQDKVTHIAASGYSSLFVTSTNKIYAMGTLHDLTLEKITQIPIETKNEIVSAVGGGRHFCVIDSEGQLFCAGRCEEGQCGVKYREQEMKNDQIKFHQVRGILDKKVAKVAAGFLFTVVLTKDNEVFSFGNGESGVLGIETTDRFRQTFVPQKIKFDPSLVGPNNKPVDICAGSEHILILFENGDVFSLGSNLSSQLGRKTYQKKEFEAKKVSLSTKATQIKCGGDFNIITDERRNFYVFGWNGLGQIGPQKVQHEDDQVTKPSLLQVGNYNDNIKEAFPGPHSHTLLLTDDGKLLMLGDYVQFTKRYSPEEIDLQGAVPVAASLGYKHSLILTKDNKVLAFGDNSMHQFN